MHSSFLHTAFPTFVWNIPEFQIKSTTVIDMLALASSLQCLCSCCTCSEAVSWLSCQSWTKSCTHLTAAAPVLLVLFAPAQGQESTCCNCRTVARSSNRPFRISCESSYRLHFRTLLRNELNLAEIQGLLFESVFTSSQTCFCLFASVTCRMKITDDSALFTGPPMFPALFLFLRIFQFCFQFKWTLSPRHNAAEGRGLVPVSSMVEERAQKKASFHNDFSRICCLPRHFCLFLSPPSRWHNSSVLKVQSFHVTALNQLTLNLYDRYVVLCAAQTSLAEFKTAACGFQIRRAEVKGAGQPHWGKGKCSYVMRGGIRDL